MGEACISFCSIPLTTASYFLTGKSVEAYYTYWIGSYTVTFFLSFSIAMIRHCIKAAYKLFIWDFQFQRVRNHNGYSRELDRKLNGLWSSSWDTAKWDRDGWASETSSPTPSGTPLLTRSNSSTNYGLGIQTYEPVGVILIQITILFLNRESHSCL